jgi:hypothetical protein
MLAHHSLDAGQRGSGGQAIGDFIETRRLSRLITAVDFIDLILCRFDSVCKRLIATYTAAFFV